MKGTNKRCLCPFEPPFHHHHPNLSLLPMNDSQSSFDHFLTWKRQHHCNCIVLSFVLFAFCLFVSCMFCVRLCLCFFYVCLTWKRPCGVVHAVVNSCPALLGNKNMCKKDIKCLMVLYPEQNLNMQKQPRVSLFHPRYALSFKSRFPI